MLWNEFLAGLDAIRAEIRSSRGLKAPCPSTDPIFEKIHGLLTAAFSGELVRKLPEPTRVDTAQMGVVPITTAIGDDLAAIAPVDEAKPTARVQYTAERPASEGGGTMKVIAREKPFVPKAPVLEEVDEEKLGK